MAKPREKPKVPEPRSRVADYAQYLALRLVQMTLQSWPPDFAIGLANLLGDVMFRIDRKHRERALHNIRFAFPEKSEAWRWDIARRSLRNEIFSLGVEFLFTTRKIRIGSIATVFEFEGFRKALDLMLRNDRGMVLLSGHFGNWEVLGYALAMMGFETTSVARPLDNPYVYDFVIGVRERQGQRIIAKKGMTELVHAAFERREMVGLVADQDAGKKGLFVDFFHRKASTYKSIGLLAMQYQLPVVVGYCRRVEGEYRFTIGAKDVIEPADWADADDPLAYITQRYTRAIESIVRDAPAQYLWMHRRWKTRPKGEVADKFD